MCTVTWLQSSDGYQLHCNRDERHTRLLASDPLIQSRHGVRFIAPIDGNHSGSWIAVNQFGVTFSLLNRYPSTDSLRLGEKTFQSRGLLVLDLVDCCSLAEARDRINCFCLDEFQPFTLVGLESYTPPVVWNWTGVNLLHLSNSDSAPPLISSSFDQEGVENLRRRLFDRMLTEQRQVDSKLLHAFHASHLPFRGAYSPCMHREDASTVSHSSIKVSEDRIEFSYFPGPPCEQAETLQETKKETRLRTLILPPVKEWMTV